MQPPKIVTIKGMCALWIVKCLCLDMAGLAWPGPIVFMWSSCSAPARGQLVVSGVVEFVVERTVVGESSEGEGHCVRICTSHTIVGIYCVGSCV